MCKKITSSNNDFSAVELNDRERGERGAALVTVLLVTTLLLGFCGALLLTTSGTAAHAFNSTAEMQAYYAAETGLQATLDVLRGNVAPWDPTLASLNTKISFQNAITPDKSNYLGDPSTTAKIARLSGWLVYDGTYNDRVAITSGYTPSNGVAYSVRIKTADNVLAGLEPKKVWVEVTGYGPRNAVKKMEMVVVKTFTGSFTAPSAITLIGSPTTAASITLGNSNAEVYNGTDQAKPTSAFPAIGVTTSNDLTAVRNAITSTGANVSPTPQVLSSSSIPYYAQSADNARRVLVELKSIAETLNPSRSYTTATPPTDIGTPEQPRLTFVEGNMSLSQSYGTGAGILVVTGTLVLDGNYSFQGLILVMGEGKVVRSGAGNGTLSGAMLVASFDQSAYGTPFLAPTFNTSGGGNSTVNYNSEYATRAIGMTVRRPLGIVER